MKIETPDISEISLTDLQYCPFPLLPDYRIAISRRAYETIYRHAKENTAVEIGGVLVGDIYKDTQGPYLEITEAIRGEHTVNHAGQITFTHETWCYINNVKDSRFPDKRIVGWYHSHPRFGIFLSPQDTFIHSNFFNLPWQVAFVFDPISDDEGFFVWHNGKPIPIEQYWLDGHKKSVAGSTNDSAGKITDRLETMVKPVLKHGKWGLLSFQFFIGLLITTVLLTTNLIRTENHFNRLLAAQKPHPAVDNLSGSAEEIKKRMAQNKFLSELNLRIIQKGNHIWCSGEVYTWQQKELIAQVIGSVEGVESVDLQGISVTHRYITSAGDSLGSIAAKVYGNPDQWRNIFQANREKIKDPHKLQPLITLVLPE